MWLPLTEREVGLDLGPDHARLSPYYWEGALRVTLGHGQIWGSLVPSCIAARRDGMQLSRPVSAKRHFPSVAGPLCLGQPLACGLH